MTKIVTTIGPSSDGKNLNYFVKNSDIIRLNLSHGTFSWHKKTINQIRKIDKNKLILVDIPGIKPRTLNNEDLDIKKGQVLKFVYNKSSIQGNIIKISNPIPKNTKRNKYFYLSDGLIKLKLSKIKNKILTGVALQNFVLKPKKGLNIPFSEYDNTLQEKLYFSNLKKISKLNIDCVGLSFIQNISVLSKIRKKYPNLILVSKIENFLGYKNRKEIIKYSDTIMIDRGDLSAEVGVNQLFKFSENIIEDAKKVGTPVIVATENLNSLINNTQPTKSDIVNLEYYLQKKIEFMMLSDETATSNYAKNTIRWLSQYLSKNKFQNKERQLLKIENLINNIKNETVILFSKKGYFYEKLNIKNLNNLVLFTENRNLIKKIQLKYNSVAYYVKFPKKYLYDFLYKNIKKNKSSIFNLNNKAYLINVVFPRKNSRANSLTIVEKKDFDNVK